MNVITETNTGIIQEAMEMSRKVTLEQVIENTGLGAKWEARGEARCKAKGKAEIARNLKKMGLTVSQIVEGTGLSPDEVARC
jgi:predicted transposase YdaD